MVSVAGCVNVIDHELLDEVVRRFPYFLHQCVYQDDATVLALLEQMYGRIVAEYQIEVRLRAKLAKG